MVLSPVSILGGDSVYCINEAQMNQAKQLAEEDPDSSIKIKSMIKSLESDFSRNERAALAFTIIDNLRENRDKYNGRINKCLRK
tara:strand:- start:492 stop:743 length:252 start_codon:yes stop_codon:yes gene_type:complete